MGLKLKTYFTRSEDVLTFSFSQHRAALLLQETERVLRSLVSWSRRCIVTKTIIRERRNRLIPRRSVRS